MEKNYLKAFTVKNKVTGQSSFKFFTEENVNGVKSLEGFKNYVLTSSRSELSHLHDILEATSQGAYINNVLKPVFDLNEGHEIIWFNLKHPKRELPPRRIQFDEDLLYFFQRYQLGKVNFNLSLKDLIKETGLEVGED